MANTIFEPHSFSSSGSVTYYSPYIMSAAERAKLLWDEKQDSRNITALPPKVFYTGAYRNMTPLLNGLLAIIVSNCIGDIRAIYTAQQSSANLEKNNVYVGRLLGLYDFSKYPAFQNVQHQSLATLEMPNYIWVLLEDSTGTLFLQPLVFQGLDAWFGPG